MSQGLTFVEKDPQNTVEIADRLTVFGLLAKAWRARTQILDYLARRGEKPTGNFFVYYKKVDWERLEKASALKWFCLLFCRWEMRFGFPTDVLHQDEGVFRGATIEGGRYIQCLHEGSYFKMLRTYQELLKEIRKAGVAIKDEVIEVCQNDPAGAKRCRWKTLILIPVKED